MYNSQAAQYGGSIAIGHFLLNIDSEDGAYASEIAPMLGMESTSLSRIIKTLEKEKMIIRKSDKTDKRRVKIILTQKGKENKELAKNIVRNFNSELENKIGRAKLEDFMKTLNEIIHFAEEKHKILKQGLAL
jgi:DNA-binding MarR family transcriptional regulator